MKNIRKYLIILIILLIPFVWVFKGYFIHNIELNNKINILKGLKHPNGVQQIKAMGVITGGHNGACSLFASSLLIDNKSESEDFNQWRARIRDHYISSNVYVYFPDNTAPDSSKTYYYKNFYSNDIANKDKWYYMIYIDLEDYLFKNFDFRCN